MNLDGLVEGQGQDQLLVTIGLQEPATGVEAVGVGVVVRLIQALAVALVDEGVQVDLEMNHQDNKNPINVNYNPEANIKKQRVRDTARNISLLTLSALSSLKQRKTQKFLTTDFTETDKKSDES